MVGQLASRIGAPAPELAVALGVGAATLAVAAFNGSQSVEAIGGFTIAAWWLVGVLAAGDLLRRPGGLGLLALAALGGYAVLQAASLAWASDDGLVLIELLRTLGYLGLLVAVTAGVPRRYDGAVLGGLAIGLAAVAVLALGARLLPGLIAGDQVRLQEFPDAGGRLGYPIAYWNALGFAMATLTLLCCWLGSAAARPRRRAAAIAVIPAALLVLYLTGSRGGLLELLVGLAVLSGFAPVRMRLLGGLGIGVVTAIGPVALTAANPELVAGAGDDAARDAGTWVALALLVAVGLAGWLRLRLDRRLRLPPIPAAMRGWRPLAGFAGLAVAAFLAVGGPDRLAQFDETDTAADAGQGQIAGRFLETGSRERTLLWETALDAVAEQPLHGIGAGAFTYFSAQNRKVLRPVRDAHSLYLESIAELGPFGLAAIVALLGAGVAGVVRRTYGDRRGTVAAAGAVLAAGLLGLGIDWLWEVPATMGPLVVVIGLLAGRATERPQRDRASGAERLGRPSLAVGALVGILAVALAGSFILGERALDESRQRAADDELPAAASAAYDATRLLPEDSRPWVQLGSVQRLAGDYEAAADSYRAAISRAPEDPRPNALLALVYAELEDPRAVEQAARAARLAPS